MKKFNNYPTKGIDQFFKAKFEKKEESSPEESL
jgi:hypothetical protein